MFLCVALLFERLYPYLLVFCIMSGRLNLSHMTALRNTGLYYVRMERAFAVSGFWKVGGLHCPEACITFSVFAVQPHHRYHS